MEDEKPITYMFTDLKRFGRLGHGKAAQILLTDRPIWDGNSPRSRAEDRYFLSRQVVHSMPGYLPETFFAPFDASAQAIAAHIIADRAPEDGRAAIKEHYLHETLSEFRQVLRAWNINDELYANALGRAATMPLAHEQSRCTVYLMLFIVTACLGDPARAIELTRRFASEKLMGGFSTQDVELGNDEPELSEGDVRLGLVRVVHGKLKAHIYPLSCEPEGTVVGLFATGDHAIIDVENDVSRSHLRLWRENGRWYAEGLNSRFGTILISGDDRSEKVIEPPRSERTASWTPTPCEILPGDMLRLGSDTQFMVLEIAE